MMAVERDASPHTLSAYARDLADAEASLGAGGLMGADEAAIEAWFAGLSTRGLSAATPARRRSAVRQFYRFALGEGWRTDDPSRRLDAPKQGRPLPRILSREEVDALLAAAAARDGTAGPAHARPGRAGLRLGPAGVGAAGACGSRRCAAIPAYLIVRGKGGKERLAPLNASAREAVKAWLVARDAARPEKAPGQPLAVPVQRGARAT